MRIRKTKEEHELSGTITKHPEYKHYGSSKDLALPESVKVEPDRHYQKETKQAWHMVIRPLQNLKVLTELDLPLLGSLFDIYDDYVMAAHTVESLKAGLDPSDKEGFETFLKAENWKRKSFEVFSKTASKYGLTPTDRTRLEIPEVEEPDPLAALLGEV